MGIMSMKLRLSKIVNILLFVEILVLKLFVEKHEMLRDPSKTKESTVNPKHNNIPVLNPLNRQHSNSVHGQLQW